jgi:hypothetical protein
LSVLPPAGAVKRGLLDGAEDRRRTAVEAFDLAFELAFELEEVTAAAVQLSSV